MFISIFLTVQFWALAMSWSNTHRPHHSHDLDNNVSYITILFTAEILFYRKLLGMVM